MSANSSTISEFTFYGFWLPLSIVAGGSCSSREVANEAGAGKDVKVKSSDGPLWRSSGPSE